MSSKALEPRIFIFHEESEGKAIAQDLGTRLETEGFAIWENPTAREESNDWWTQVTNAIDHVDHVVLVVTPKALETKMVRRVWRYARKLGAGVVPIRGASDLDEGQLVGWMHQVHFLDDQDPDDWADFIEYLKMPNEARCAPFMAEDLPDSFVVRPAEFDTLIGELLDENLEMPVPTVTALCGAVGSGKTTLAQAICHDERIQDAFHDGVLWVTLGPNPGRLGSYVNDLCYRLDPHDVEVGWFEDLLGNRHFLIVIDDVWSTDHLRPFIREGPNCARLITTRTADILPSNAHRIDIGAMQTEQAVELLSPKPPADQVEALGRLAGRLGAWPLLLRLAKSLLRMREHAGTSLDYALAEINHALDREGVPKDHARSLDERDQAMAAMLGVCLDQLNVVARARFHELAVFPEDVDIPLATLELLLDCDRADAEELCRQWLERSLLRKLDLTTHKVRLHDTVRKYLRDRTADVDGLNSKLIDVYQEYCAGCWHAGPNDGYFFQHLLSHLDSAGKSGEVQNLLFDYRWLRRKLQATDGGSVVDDLERFGGGVEADALAQLFRLAIPQPEELAGQLWGRLRGHQGPRLERLLADAREQSERPALLPCHPTLLGQSDTFVRTLPRLDSRINALAVTPNGKRAVSGSWDNTLTLWDLEKDTVIAILRGHNNKVTSVVITPDGTRAVSGSYDRTIKVWCLESGAVINTFEGHSALVRALAITPDGTRVVSGSRDKTLKVWDLATGAVLVTLEGHSAPINAVATTPDSKRVVSGSYDCTLIVWDLETGSATATLDCRSPRTDSGHINAVAITPDGKRAVAGYFDNTLKVWDLETGAILATLEGHNGHIWAVTITLDGTRVLSGSYDSTLKVWDLATGAVIDTLEGHSASVPAVAIMPDGTRAISGSWDKTLKIWDLATGPIPGALEEHRADVTAVAMTSDGARVVSGSYDRTLKIWGVETGKIQASLEGKNDRVTSVAIMQNGARAVSGYWRGNVVVWNLETGAAEATLKGHSARVTAVALRLGGERAVSGTCHGKIVIWDLKAGKFETVVEGHRNREAAIAMTPDGMRAVRACQDGTVEVWDLVTGALKATLDGNGNKSDVVAITPDGTRAVSASRGGLNVWNLETNALMSAFQSDGDEPDALAIAPGGSRAVSASSHRLKLWDLTSGKAIAVFSADASIHCCAVSPDGRFVAAGDADGRMHMLEIVE